jgi:hypothetical protein
METIRAVQALWWGRIPSRTEAISASRAALAPALAGGSDKDASDGSRDLQD